MLKIYRLLVLCIAMCLPVTQSVRAQEVDDDGQKIEALRQTTIRLIELMVESGLITQEKAEELLRESERAAAETTPAETPGETVIRVPYVPETVREEIKEEIREEVVAQANEERWGQPDAYPEWLDRFTFFGDLRFRYQYNQFDDSNAPALDVQRTNQGAGPVLANTTENFDQWRIRARFGFEAQAAEWVSVGLRLATGNLVNPVSTNETLGNSFNSVDIALDRAYIELTPYDWMSARFGRFGNPFFHTELVWDSDLNFDGIALAMERSFAPATKGFLTLGAFPLESLSCATADQNPDCGNDKWLYGIQGGIDQGLIGGNRLKFGVALYDYRNIAGSFNDPVVDPGNRASIPQWVQKGNTLFNVVTSGGNPLLGLAADYQELNLTADLDIGYFEPMWVKLNGDFVENIGYDRAEVFSRTGGLVDEDPRTTGYSAKLTVGHPEVGERHHWQLFGGYRYLQRDAVVDGFADSDFHLGGTDTKGWVVGGRYGLATRTWFSLRWLTANEIDGPPLAIDVLQADLNAEF